MQKSIEVINRKRRKILASFSIYDSQVSCSLYSSPCGPHTQNYKQNQQMLQIVSIYKTF